MVSEILDYKALLLDNYKKLKLSENEVVVILMIDQLLNEGNPFITADLLSLKMNLEVKTLDDILASLMKKKLLDFTTKGKKTGTSLEPLKKKLYDDFQLMVRKDAEEEDSDKLNDDLNSLISIFEGSFERSLSPVEKNKIYEWLPSGYQFEDVVNALKDCINFNKKTIRSVEKTLLNYKIREDIEKEGHTSIDKNWDKNLEETIKIAKTPWIDDDK